MDTPVSYQLEFNTVKVAEAKSVIERTFGSGAMDQDRASQLLTAVAARQKSWFDEHADAKIIGRIPFYGLRDKPVAYEYLLGCSGTICGSIYDVFPGAENMNQALDMFYK